MTLIDTSVWVDHLRLGNARLGALLEEEAVLTHPFVIGELACGALRNRSRFFAALAVLPTARTAAHEDVVRLIEDRKMCGKGIGWTDAHLLASALISGCGLWSLDRSLMRLCNAVGVSS